jgi:hypothetical protein
MEALQGLRRNLNDQSMEAFKAVNLMLDYVFQEMGVVNIKLNEMKEEIQGRNLLP